MENALGNTSIMLCYNPLDTTHKSVWSLGNPLGSPTSLLFFQISLITIVTQFLYACLKPLGQTSLVSQILVSFFLTYMYFFTILMFNDHHM